MKCDCDWVGCIGVFLGLMLIEIKCVVGYFLCVVVISVFLLVFSFRVVVIMFCWSVVIKSFLMVVFV